MKTVQKKKNITYVPLSNLGEFSLESLSLGSENEVGIIGANNKETALNGVKIFIS